MDFWQVRPLRTAYIPSHPCDPMDPKEPPVPKPPSPAPTPQAAAALRARRRALGLTQVELGRYAGCGPDFVYDLEAGKPTIRLDKLLDVLAVLGLSLRVVDGRVPLTVDEALRPARDEAKG